MELKSLLHSESFFIIHTSQIPDVISIIILSNYFVYLHTLFAQGLSCLNNFFYECFYVFLVTRCAVLVPSQIAARLRVAANEKAEAEKILQIKRAEGDAESKYLAGLGVARQRQAIVDGLRDSVLAFSENVPGTTSKDIMDMVLITQYFDTIKEIGASSKSNAVFIPHGPGAVQDVASHIRDGLLQGNATQCS